MYIKHLKIEKFRAVENVEFDFTNGINALGGENGIGKTSVIDSIMWMLSDETLVNGKDNASNIDVRNKEKRLFVELVLELADGTDLILQREYKPSFTKTGEFSSYSNKFWINGAEYTSKDYIKRLKEELGLNKIPEIKSFNPLRALIDFNYFGSIDYKIARELIENVLHLENENDIVNKEDYMLIKNDLIGQNYDVAKVKTMYNTQKSIKENEILKTETSIKTLTETIKPIDKELYNKLKNNYNELKEKDYEHSAEYKVLYDELQKSLDSTNKIWSEISKLKSELEVLEIKNQNILNPLQAKNKEIDNLREDFVRIKKTIRVCPNCNYELNKDEILEELKKINERGQILSKEIAELTKLNKTEEVDSLKKTIKEKEKTYHDMMLEQQELSSKGNELFEKEDKEQALFYREKEQTLNDLNWQIASMEKEADTSSIDKLKEVLENQRKDLAVVELKQQLIVDFEKEKINKIQSEVDKVFPGIEFVLTEISERGAEQKTCKPTYKGVDYRKLNDGQRIKIGFEIIDDLNRVYSIFDTLPIIFDKFRDLSKKNILSLKEITKSQIFTTYVSNEENITIYNI